MSVDLLCPVRGCGGLLDRSSRTWRCPRGHAFDLARSGYCNLLQPQDRRSSRPGDSESAVAARRRLVEAGFAAPLHAALRAEIAALALGPGRSVLDVGCGEGTLLGSLTGELGVEGHGLDLAAAAVDLAARRFPGVTWVVANADRSLPYAGASFDLVLSVDARLQPQEIHRVLRPEGALLLAVPAPDDLIELRAAVLGAGEEKDRFSRAEALLAERFRLARRTVSRTRFDLSAPAARDVLAATYRAGRASRLAAIEGLAALLVTQAHDIGLFRPAPAPGSGAASG
jgi:23S rRNA (guanine745-N1)-methyltransferase